MSLFREIALNSMDVLIVSLRALGFRVASLHVDLWTREVFAN